MTGPRTVGPRRPAWTGDSSWLSLLEIAAAHGLPVGSARHCGEAVRTEFQRRRAASEESRSALKEAHRLPRMKESRGEGFPVGVYPAVDVPWIVELMERQSGDGCAGCSGEGAQRQQRLWKRARQCDDCAAGARPTKRGPAAAGAAVLLAPCVASAAGPWTAAVARRLAVAVPAHEADAGDTQGCSSATHRLAKWGYTEALQALLDKGANVDGRTPDGRTPLMAAAGGHRGSVGTIRLLLSSGASWEAVDVQGRTALDLARGRCELGRWKNYGVVRRFDAEASLLVLDSWARASESGRGAMHALRLWLPAESEPEPEPEPESVAAAPPSSPARLPPQEWQPDERRRWAAVDAKAVLCAMWERDQQAAQRGAQSRRGRRGGRVVQQQPEPEPEQVA